ncbi:hypothetical protein NMY22_g17311 [Coprinellus aureogranulatus]|nr:hypothetical protein NMY22_g17311 [Coprinellus aureogranulatus]
MTQADAILHTGILRTSRYEPQVTGNELFTNRRTHLGPNLLDKVANEIFHIPTHGLVQQSSVFADMFLLPQSRAAEGIRTEGRTEQNPISLEGYQPDEFRCLLKVIYPTTDDVLNGGFNLAKGEWLQVLKLATVWLMQKIRQHAIQMLSQEEPSPLALTSMEKVTTGRSHQVRKWLLEGVTSLVRMSSLPDDAIQVLGIETVCQILQIRASYSPLQDFVPSDEGLRFALSCLNCVGCDTQYYIEGSWSCASCGRSIDRHDRDAVFVTNGSAVLESYNGLFRVRIKPMAVQCVTCKDPPVRLSGHRCTVCGRSGDDCEFVVSAASVLRTQEKAILRQFGSEVAEDDDEGVTGLGGISHLVEAT